MFLKIIFAPTLSEGDLIDRNAQFLLPLTYRKDHPTVKSGGRDNFTITSRSKTSSKADSA